MQRPLIFTIASAIALGFAGAAPAAAANYESAAQTVSYADLNLDNRAGAEVMLRRIERAAAVVCRDQSGTMSLAQRASIRQCLASKTQRAVAAVGHGGLTALYNNRNPQILIAAD